MDISPANELDNVNNNNNIQSTNMENINNMQSSGQTLQGNSMDNLNQTNQPTNTSDQDIKASNEFGGYTEIHSTELNKKDEGDNGDINKINTAFLIFMTVLVFILIPIYLIIRYSLYDDLLPYIKTNIFFLIRQGWIFVILGCIYLPFLIIKYIKILIVQIRDTIAYIFNPLKEYYTTKRYNSFKYNKIKKMYIIFARVWFTVILIILLVWFMFLLLIMLILCYMIGNMIGWMDYFWILR
jgi:hypothetical protein